MRWKILDQHFIDNLFEASASSAPHIWASLGSFIQVTSGLPKSLVFRHHFRSCDSNISNISNISNLGSDFADFFWAFFGPLSPSWPLATSPHNILIYLLHVLTHVRLLPNRSQSCFFKVDQLFDIIRYEAAVAMTLDNVVNLQPWFASFLRSFWPEQHNCFSHMMLQNTGEDLYCFRTICCQVWCSTSFFLQANYISRPDSGTRLILFLSKSLDHEKVWAAFSLFLLWSVAALSTWHWRHMRLEQDT